MGSILAQTYPNFEVICIDDCSTDGTYEKLKEYEEKDGRVKVLRNSKNQGLAFNRNKSLELATGKYVMFVDGDDIMHKDLVKKAVEYAENNSSDMVMWDYETFVYDTEINSIDILKSNFDSKRNDDKSYLLERPAFTWTKLIKTDVAKSLGINFPFGLTRQDIPVHWHLITSPISIGVISEKLSFYRQQPNATTAQSDKRVFDLITVTNIVKEQLQEDGIFHNYKDQWIRHQLNFMFGVLDKVKSEYKDEAQLLVNENFSDEHIKYVSSGKPLRWQARQYFRMKSGSMVATVLYKVWYFTRCVFRAVK